MSNPPCVTEKYSPFVAHTALTQTISSDRKFILLRGYPAAGKTRTTAELKKKLEQKGTEAVRIDLDSNAPDVEESKFWEEIKKATLAKVVLGELFSGRWHSEDPKRWMGSFKKYEFHCFLLDVSLQTGFIRVNDSRRDFKIPSKPNYEQLINNFWVLEKEKPFIVRAGLEIEKRLNAESGNYSALADFILKDVGI